MSSNNFSELLVARVEKRIKVNWITGIGGGLPGVVRSVGDDYFVLTAASSSSSSSTATQDFHIPFASVLHFQDID